MATLMPARIKEELPSWEDGTSISTHTASPTIDAKYPSAGIKEEPRSDNGGEPQPDIPTAQIKEEPNPSHYNYSHYLTNPIKEEPCDYDEGQFFGGGGITATINVPPPRCSAHYTSSLYIKEEADVGFTSVCIKEEPVSGDDDFPRGISGVFPDSSALGGDEEMDSLSVHTEIEYTTVLIKGEESSEEDYVEVIPDTGHYATRDHTYMVTRTDDHLKATCSTRKLHKTLNCSECGRLFFGKAAYRLHQRLHRGEAVYSCSTCGKKFSRKGSCEKHQEAAHSREKSFECANCDRYFSSKLGLTLHQRVHTREPAFSCKDCAMSFTSNSALIQHQRVHYTDRRLLCAKCGVTFDNKSDLINHEILHPVQQYFMCSECSERFLTKAELSAHWKVHTVIKAFSWRKIRFTHQETRSPEETAPSSAGRQ